MCRLVGASKNTSIFFGLNGRHLPLKNEIWMLRSQKNVFAAYNATCVEKAREIVFICVRELHTMFVCKKKHFTGHA